MKVTTLISLLTVACIANAADFDYATIQSPTGIYFDSWGYVRLYSAKWKLITYINVEPARNMLGQIKQLSKLTLSFCDTLQNKTWYSSTGCSPFRPYIVNKIRQLDELKEVIVNFANYESNSRTKRGVLNFVGQVSKVLFGTLDTEDAQYYTSKIIELENDQKSFLKLTQEQLLVIKSAVTSFNSTVRDVYRNEKILREGLIKLTEHVNQENFQLNEEIQALAMISGHRMQMQTLIEATQGTFELVVDALIHAQDGILQPQIISLAEVRKMSNEQSMNGFGYLGQLSAPELMKLIIPHIYLHGKYLVYILEIPLLLPEELHLYKILPFPSPSPNRTQGWKYAYIESSKDFIISDSLHHKFAKLSQYQVNTCTQINELKFVCEETFPLTSYQAGEDCEATLLHPSSTEVPRSCSYRLMELQHTLWIKLLGNEWLHVTPKNEIFTSLCGSNAPRSTTLQGRGRIQLAPGCKGYTAHTTIYAYATIVSNSTHPDIIPFPPIDLDCCLTTQQQQALHKLQLSLPMNNILSHSDELKVASYKIDEVNELLESEKWRLEHAAKLSYTSWAATLGVITIVIIISVCCACCCCKCCRSMGFRLWKAWEPLDCRCCPPGRNSIQQTIHTGEVHYHGSTVSLPTALSTRTKNLATTEATPFTALTSDENKEEDTSVGLSPLNIRGRKPLSTWR